MQAMELLPTWEGALPTWGESLSTEDDSDLSLTRWLAEEFNGEGALPSLQDGLLPSPQQSGGEERDVSGASGSAQWVPPAKGQPWVGLGLAGDEPAARQLRCMDPAHFAPCQRCALEASDVPPLPPPPHDLFPPRLLGTRARLTPRHLTPRPSCCAPPDDGECDLFRLIGGQGFASGEKKLRKLISNLPEWRDAASMARFADHAERRGDGRLAALLRAGRSTDLRKNDMLAIARHFGYASDAWCAPGGAAAAASWGPLGPMF